MELADDDEYQEALRDFLEGSDEDTDMPDVEDKETQSLDLTGQESLDLPAPDLVVSDSSDSSDPDDLPFMPSNRK